MAIRFEPVMNQRRCVENVVVDSGTDAMCSYAAACGALTLPPSSQNVRPGCVLLSVEYTPHETRTHSKKKEGLSIWTFKGKRVYRE
jgi:hypothetical protein